MKILFLPLLLALATVSTASQAAPKPKRTFEQCNDLATQRGFSAQERGGGRKRFIAGCMKGQVQ